MPRCGRTGARSRSSKRCEGEPAQHAAAATALPPRDRARLSRLRRCAAARAPTASSRRSNRQRLLAEARAAMEQYKAAELRDYFRDECVADIEARTVDLDRVLRRQAPKTAVVYPIALEDRLELLVSLPRGLERSSRGGARRAARRGGGRGSATGSRSPIGAHLAPGAAALSLARGAVREATGRRRASRRWSSCRAASLRTIPLGALYDGKRFLLEHFALAVTPGLSLVDPHALAPERGAIPAGRASRRAASSRARRFEPLPKVGEEIGAIQKLYGGDVLLDAGFDGPRFRQRSRRAASRPSCTSRRTPTSGAVPRRASC